MMMNKNRKYIDALVACLLLVCTLLHPAIAEVKSDDPRTMGEVVILEDATLIGDLDEYLKNVFTMAVADETETPTEEPTEEPTTEPSDEPTTPPTSPSSAAYDIQMESPSGWFLNRTMMEITIEDTGKTGWTNVHVTMGRSGGTVTLIDGPLPSGHIWIDLIENCTIETTITDPSGKEHSKQVTVSCFDKENPTIVTSINGEFLLIEAKDGQSGIAAIYVNGTMYTELTGGKLEVKLKEYADAYEQLIVQAVDKVGNVSKAIAVANPFYKNKNTPTPKPTATPKPAATPKPTKKPPASGGSSGSGSGSSGNGSSGSGASNSATATPTMDPTPTPVVTPSVANPITSIEEGFPFSFPGNSYTRDLLYDKATNKQFIAIETRNGDVFYLVIDYDKPLDSKGERYETFFLNLVDSRDMLDIVGDLEEKEPEIIYVTPEPTIQPTPEPIIAPEPVQEKDNGGGMLGIVAILLVAGGGAFWYFKIRKPGGAKSKASFDDFDDYDDDDYEDDEPEENEDE